jgi:hypothetical protein
MNMADEASTFSINAKGFGAVFDNSEVVVGNASGPFDTQTDVRRP